MSLELTLTDGGLTALAAAIAAGTDFTIDSVEVGEGQYTPSSSATALTTPFSPARVFTDPAGFVDENRIAFNFEDNGSDAYDVGEIGVFSGTTLFALGSQPSTDGFIFSKAADTDLLVSVHTVVSGVADISAITFANTLLTNTNVDAGNIVSGTLDADRLDSVPASTLTGTIHTDRIPNLSADKITSGSLDVDRVPTGIPGTSVEVATEIARGTVERASDEEVDAGTDDERYVTPAGVQRRHIPTGAILDFAGSSAPDGYLLCDGQVVSRTTYAALYAVVGDTWGNGNGSTTFNVPDLRGRTTIGVDGSAGRQGGDLSDLGETGGSSVHTLTTAQMPAHRHLVVRGTTTTYPLEAPTQTLIHIARAHNGTDSEDYVLGGTSQEPNYAPSEEVGGGGAHSNMQPSAVVNKVIKT